MGVSGRKKVLIVDDHPIVRLGLAQLIGQTSDLEVCGDAADILGALRQVEASEPDVVIVDIALDQENGLELIEHIHARWPVMKMLVSSARDEQVYAGRALRAGAMGYVSKHEGLPQIVEALRQVLRGDVYLSAAMASRLLRRAATGESLGHDPIENLTNRELEVFGMIGQGLSTLEIAGKLQLSPKTIESHRKLIKMKLGVQTGAQLNRIAFQWAQEDH